jgi:hypothetical protein
MVKCVVFLVVALVTENAAGCLMNPHVGVGPVVGITPGRGFVLGWEAGGGADGLLRANIGGSYRYVRPKIQTTTSDYFSDGRSKNLRLELVHYLAYEPGLIGGGTLGIAYSDWEGFAGSYGLWCGMPAPLSDPVLEYQKNPFSGQEGKWTPMIAFTVGWRYLAGEHEVYFAPKFVYAFSPSMGD